MRFISSAFSYISTLIFPRNNIWAFIISNILLATILLVSPVKVKLFGDNDFHEEAKIIAKYIHGDCGFEEVSITKAPGPILFFSFPYTLAGKRASDSRLLIFGVIWTLILNIILLAYTYVLIAKYYSFLTANLFALLTLIIPLHIYYSLGILAEGFAFAGCLLFLIGFINFSKTSKFSLMILGITIMVLSRPNIGLMIPLLILFAFIMYTRSKNINNICLLKTGLYSLLLILAISIFVKVLPNNRKTMKQEEYLAYVMHIGRFQFRTEELDWRFWDSNNRPDSKDYQDYISSVNNLEKSITSSGNSKSKVYYSWLIKDILNHPFMTFKQFFIRIAFGNTLKINSINVSKYEILGFNANLVYGSLMLILNLINLVIIGFAVYFLSVRGNIVMYWPLLTLIIALLVFNGFVYMEQRYLFPIRPILIFWAALGLENFIKSKYQDQNV